MIEKIRPITEEDKILLAESISKDEYHKDNTDADFFYEYGSICNVYEDKTGPVMFVRGTQALRLDIQFINNENKRRNVAMMMQGFPTLAKQAKEAGFTEIIFNSTSELLRSFCIKYFGFEVSGDELRRLL